MNPFPFYPPPHPAYGIPIVPTVPPPIQSTTVITAPILVPTSQTQSLSTLEKPPVTTVFVGNIAETVSDTVIKNILMRCGNMLKWKRVERAQNKLQAFGFCEFERPESTMRCVRLLNGFSIHGKALLVKVDSKTEETLSEYVKKQEAKNAAETEDQKKKDDQKVRDALTIIIENAQKEENLVLESKSDNKKKELDWQSMEGMDLDDEKRNVIEREVNAFRSKFEKNEEKDDKKRIGPSAIGAAAMKLAPDSISNVEIRDNYRRKERSRSRSPRRRNPVPTGTITAFGSKTRTTSSEADFDPQEEAIRRRLERKLREKEDSYTRLFEDWTTRERKKALEYQREAERERKKQEDLSLEAERLKEFFEDYDDELEDPRYYKGSALERRLAAREYEKALDERDRQKEVEQIEIARQKLMDEGDPNAESIILQMEQRMQEHLRPRLDLNAPEITVPPLSVTFLPPISNHNGHYQKAQQNEELPKTPQTPETLEQTQKDPLLFSLSNNANEAQRLASWRRGNERFVADLKAEEEEEELRLKEEELRRKEEKAAAAVKPKYTPGWLPPSAKQSESGSSNQPPTTSAQQLTEDEKKHLIRDIIKRIPTEKELLFAYPLEWEVVDTEFVATHIRPWVDKKMMEYIGEVEAALCQFVCDQVLNHNPPHRILQDISMVLDEEAEGFVVKLWRLLIYVIAAKKAGLA